jgi:hypothetical protein
VSFVSGIMQLTEPYLLLGLLFWLTNWTNKKKPIFIVELDGYPGVSMIHELEKRKIPFTGSDSGKMEYSAFFFFFCGA